MRVLLAALILVLIRPAAAQWGPLDEGEGVEEEAVEQIDLPAPGPDSARSGPLLRGLGSLGLGFWAAGSSSRGSAKYAPTILGGGGVALGPLRLEGWAAATWLRERTSVVTVREILLSTHGAASFSISLRGADIAAGALIGTTLGFTRQKVEAPILQSETLSSVRLTWGGRLQLAWKWTEAEPILELQILRRGWVFDLVAAFGFRWGLTPSE